MEATRFLPALRDDAAAVGRQSDLLRRVPMLASLLDGVPDMVLILNRRRQILFANGAARQALKDGDPIGRRGGEALCCVNAGREPGGCGTSEFCTACGLGRALARVRPGRPAFEECRVAVRRPGRDLDLRAWATPFEWAGERFTLLALQDAREENRRRALERVFYHDVLNTAGGLIQLSDLLQTAADSELPELKASLARISQRLIDEIVDQRDLASIEKREYQADPAEFDAGEEMTAVAKTYRRHRAGTGKTIQVEPGPSLRVRCDRRLLGRVLGNLVKNALEAEPTGAVVRLGWRREAQGPLCLWVANPAVMPRAVAYQVFQRSFSTKAPGRGLGAYGAKLIVETYLGGSIEFDSIEGRGTEFRVLLPPAS